MANLLHVYTGEGKGKTTASMGLAFRMLGHGNKVMIVQFMKQPNSGELAAFQKFENATVFQMPAMTKFTYQMDEEEMEEAAKNMRDNIDRMIKTIDETDPKLVVLDELAVAMQYDMVPRADGFRLIDAALKHGDVVVTGRGASSELKEKANYFSNIQAIKHPYDEGIQARKGIEW